MKRRTYKVGPSAEYQKKQLAAERAKIEAEIKKRNKTPPKFRGFLAASGFLTKKGYAGTKLDSQWARYMLEAMKNDDDELAEIALESCLADIHVQVSGGENGCPLCIGEYGFYTTNVFEKQAELLQNIERKYCTGLFLSEDEWRKIDAKLHHMASFSESKMAYAVVGDQYTSLAVRENAYRISKLLLDRGVDPLVQNGDGCDLIDVTKLQYGAMSLRLNNLQLEKKAATKKVLTPSEERDLQDREDKTIQDMNDLITFINTLKTNMERRRESVEKDKWALKVATIRQQQVPYEVRWNAGLGDTVEQHIKECDEMVEYIAEKIRRYQTNTKDLVSMGAMVKLHHKQMVHKRHVAERAQRGDAVSVSSINSPMTSPTASMAIGSVNVAAMHRQLMPTESFVAVALAEEVAEGDFDPASGKDLAAEAAAAATVAAIRGPKSPLKPLHEMSEGDENDHSVSSIGLSVAAGMTSREGLAAGLGSGSVDGGENEDLTDLSASLNPSRSKSISASRQRSQEQYKAKLSRRAAKKASIIAKQQEQLNPPKTPDDASLSQADPMPPSLTEEELAQLEAHSPAMFSDTSPVRERHVATRAEMERRMMGFHNPLDTRASAVGALQDKEAENDFKPVIGFIKQTELESVGYK